MEYIIKNRKPESMFRYFEELCSVPRPSGNEKAASDYIEDFARKNGLEYVRDEAGNVLVRRPASAGYENRPAVLLQGHIDMVCEKNADTEHDFMNEPLRLRLNGDMLSADGTTLGGDDGAGVAAMMAALTEDIPHPELECLFTTDEEVGMSGIRSFDCSQLRAARLINLDSESEGAATVSCAGGVRIKTTLRTERLIQPKIGRTVDIKLRGLAGGHSGADIHLGRANAIETAGRMLGYVYDKFPFNIVSADGGAKDNAIARECDIRVFTAEPDGFTAAVHEFEEMIRPELTEPDRKFKILTGRPRTVAADADMLSFADTSKVIAMMTLMPCGVQSFCTADRSVVESSANYGILKTEDGCVSVLLLARSSLASRLDDIAAKCARIAKYIGAEHECFNRYPGWALRTNTPLQKDYIRTASEILGREARTESIHAGLECGVIADALPEIDAISIGPDILNIHTPDETLDLASFERFWKILEALLAC